MVEALESEVYSDPDAYTDKRENFDDPIPFPVQITTKYLMTMTDTPIKLDQCHS